MEGEEERDEEVKGTKWMNKYKKDWLKKKWDKRRNKEEKKERTLKEECRNE